MFGHIHLCIKELVMDKLGEEAWERILKATQCDNARDFLVFHSYPDSIFYKLLDALSVEMKVTRDEALEKFGVQFYKYTKRHGYHKMIQTLGGDLKTFLENLDALHEYFSLTQKSMVAPSFSVDRKKNSELILHYNSSRKNLYPWIKGMLGCIAREFFNTEIQLDVLEKTSETSQQSRFLQHTVILIKMFPITSKETPRLSKSLSFGHSNIRYPSPSKSPEVTSKHLVDFLPYHIVFDSMLRIRQAGAMIQQMCVPLQKVPQGQGKTLMNGEANKSNDNLEAPVLLSSIASLEIPAVPLDPVFIRRFINAAFSFALYPDYKFKFSTSDESILLRGQICYIEESDCFLFICSPRLMTLTEMEEKQLFLSDIPLYDVTRELLLVNQQRLAEMEISKHMDEMTNQLQKTTSLLEEEKGKVHLLLKQMLPPRVATQLLQGKKVEAEKFQMCTILFSDIVTFTNIASQCNPMDVVDMLNALYSLFDKATETNGAYKVETIGDAYMVVAGVPDVSDRHAEIIAEQAMDMVEVASSVCSPVTGKPLQIRVGIHSGPVVAGVVGEKMPRFCLFGDTVNVASRMESHGVPCKVHCSNVTYQFLVDRGYIFEGRGEVEIKGKGLMRTYFLLGRGANHNNGERQLLTLNEINKRASVASGDKKLTMLIPSKTVEEKVKNTINNNNNNNTSLNKNTASKKELNKAISLDERKLAVEDKKYQRSALCRLL